MARFGQGFIQSLTQPSYQQGLFNLGQQLGSAPTRRMEQQEQSKAMTMVNEALASQDPQKLLAAAQAIQQIDPQTATKLSQAAGQLNTQRKQAGVTQLEQEQVGINENVRKSKAIREALTRGDRDSARLLREGLLSVDDYSQKLMETKEEGAMSLSDRFKTVGNRIFDVVEERYIEPSQAAESLSITQLKEVATPESIVEYAKTGDKSVLKPVVPETEKEKPASRIASNLAQTDNVLATVKEASGIYEDVWPLTYSLAKFGPTQAKALSTKVDTLKANLSFDRLSQMRKESLEEGGTGGALGQVSNIELNLLGSTVAGLDPMSPDFPQQLKKIEDSYQRYKAALLGKKPPGDKYIEDNGVLYYVNEDEEGNEQFISLGAM